MRRLDAIANDDEGGSNSVVESQPSKLLVAGSIPVSRSMKLPGGSFQFADVAQLAERVLGKDEVTGPIPVIGSSLRRAEMVRLRRASLRRRASFGWASRLR